MQMMMVDVDTLARNWWVVLLRGVLGITFGLLTFVAPGVSLAALVFIFGAFAFADGVLAILTAVRRHATHGSWWTLVLQGLAGIAAGVVTIFWPGVTALVLLYLIAFWALVTGGFEIATAIRLRKELAHEWLLALSGLASVGLGALLVLFPASGALALVIWIGAYALVSGVLLVMFAFRLHAWGTSHHAPPAFSHA